MKRVWRLLLLLGVIGLVVSVSLVIRSKHNSGKELRRFPDVHFLSRDNAMISVYLMPSASESVEGMIKTVDSNGAIVVQALGVVRGFGCPFIFERPEKGQVVITPYFVGGGSGYAVYDWCLIGTTNDSVYAEPMGVYAYHSVSRDSTIFRLRPMLTKQGGTCEPILEFELKEQTNNKTNTLQGNVALKFVVMKEKVTVKLLPYKLDDARKCIELVNCKSWRASDWALMCLSSICPEEVSNLKKQRARGTYDLDITSIQRAVEKYYQDN